jgi:hypothetical protein
VNLYHFTAKRFLAGILRDGITLGKLLVRIEPFPVFRPGWQWLTTNPDFRQEWAEGTGRLPYRRNEVRITVIVPAADFLSRCRTWSQVRFLVPDVADTLDAFGDPENWWVYEGSIPPDWLGPIDEGPR